MYGAGNRKIIFIVLEKELDRINVAVCGLAEVRWKDQGHFNTIGHISLLAIGSTHCPILEEPNKGNLVLQSGSTGRFQNRTSSDPYALTVVTLSC